MFFRGRFSLRNRLSKTVIVNTHEKLCQYMDDHRIEISEIDQLSDTDMMITYKTKREFIEEHPASNVVGNFFKNNKYKNLKKIDHKFMDHLCCSFYSL